VIGIRHSSKAPSAVPSLPLFLVSQLPSAKHMQEMCKAQAQAHHKTTHYSIINKLIEACENVTITRHSILASPSLERSFQQ